MDAHAAWICDFSLLRCGILAAEGISKSRFLNAILDLLKSSSFMIAHITKGIKFTVNFYFNSISNRFQISYPREFEFHKRLQAHL